MKDKTQFRNQYYEVERKVRVSAGFHLVTGTPQLLAHRACQMLQRFRAGSLSFQSYQNIEDDPEKLSKGSRDLVEHLLWTLYNHEKKYLSK